ncbi:hypothetical protein [Butyrivibrio sp. MB2005]|uniref:hypothetical protein n=1 Tax=Butyrivibrio sp. MB2005 TaxID=1280678 RepID=UPI0004044B75|nr:hypothetical protein [Butyrivibrio sp. MB2005]
MIIAEKTEKLNSIDYDSFGEEMQDGRLTEPSDGKRYRLREAILYSKRLGRPLTDEEMSQFEI